MLYKIFSFLLTNVLHRITLISQNNNCLLSFRRRFFVSGHFEPVIKLTTAAPDNQLVHRKAVLLLLKSAQSFSAVTASVFSNVELAF